MASLADDTCVDGRDGEYRGFISPDWAIWGPNGGYVASIALQAAGAHSMFVRPASITGHFLHVAAFDSIDIDVKTLRRSRRAESMQVVLRQQDRDVFTGLVWAVDWLDGADYNRTPMPDVPEPAPSWASRMASERRWRSSVPQQPPTMASP